MCINSDARFFGAIFLDLSYPSALMLRHSLKPFTLPHSGFLELINNMLTSGMVPALFADDEKDAILNQAS